MRVILLLAWLVVVDVSALEQAELDKFISDVKLNANGDYYEFFSSGYPDHDIDNSVNPNAASVQNFTYNITINPTIEEGKIYCTSLGPVGFATNGVGIYNALTGENVDAVKNEVFDDCKGHSSPDGAYHYHQFPVCVGSLEETDQFIGIAIDGHPIYGPKASDRTELLKSSDLDLCHGRMVNGRYRYHITVDFPYVIGCYRSRPAESAYGGPPGGGGLPPPGGQQPPPGGQQPPPPGRRRRAVIDDVTCSNTDNGAELCDCSSGKTYIECEIASADSTCTAGDSNSDVEDKDDDNGVTHAIPSAVTLATLSAATLFLYN